jgi:hypothetical protein
MGSSKQTQSQSQSSSGTSRTTFAPRSQAEESILGQYRGLGDTQRMFLQDLMGGKSPYTMSETDQAMVNQSFDSANQRFMTQGKDYADYLATTRGLNKSDTPVSQQAMERFGMGLADLESQRAKAGLDYGMQGTNMRLMGAQALPAGLGAAFSPMFSERMAGGTTHTTGNSRGTTTMVNSPSLMTQIGQGMSLGSQAIGLGAQIGGMAMGMPSMPGMGGGMGSGAAANKSFGNYGSWM